MSAIIACIDDSPAAQGVAEHAVWAAQQLQQPLHFLHVLDKQRYPQPPDPLSPLDTELAKLDAKRTELGWEQGKEILVKAEKTATQQQVNCQTSQRHGRLPECVNLLAMGSPLVVMGKRGSDSKAGRFVGSQLESVIRSVNNPVLVASDNFKKPKNILVAYDNSPHSQKIIQFISTSPLFKGCEIHLLMVGHTSGNNAAALNTACESLRNSGFTVHANIQQGDVETVMLAYQNKHGIDLIVMGAYGHSRIRNFIVGSTTTQMLQYTQLPMLLFR